jgi:hypothetical protein
MAHARLNRQGATAVVFMLFGSLACSCGGAQLEGEAQVPNAASTAQSSALRGTKTLLRSEQLRLSVEVPGGAGWHVAKRVQGGASFDAEHAASHSALQITFFEEAELMNRTMCSARALERAGKAMRSLDWVSREVVAGPATYDTMIAIGVDHSGPALQGTLLATGAFLRRCMSFQFVTTIAPGEPETALADKLAAARAAFESLKLDPLRTGDHAVMR